MPWWNYLVSGGPDRYGASPFVLHKGASGHLIPQLICLTSLRRGQQRHAEPGGAHERLGRSDFHGDGHFG